MSAQSTIQPREFIVRHPDGRSVGAVLVGSPELKDVVFYSHGFPASRLEASIAHRAASERGISIVSLDRPGFGLSEWYAERRFEDWASDVSLIADHLGIERFSILGVSGGTPTAVAAAAKLSDRVVSLTIVSGVGPIPSHLSGQGALAGMNPANRVLLVLGRRFPTLGRCLVGVLARLWRRFPHLVKVWFGILLPKVDREIVSRREVSLVLARNIREALAQGIQGVVTEFLLLATDWSELLAKVHVPTTIWHGDRDTYVPLVMGENLKKGISGSIFHKVEGGGHFMILDTIERVLEGIKRVR
jgi:pimeloyl-ACP methyl ester carboxylesterase